MSRVFLHVGAPKTGTTQLQDTLFVNRETLGEHGVLYPGDRFDSQFLAALDLLGKKWGGLEKSAVGAWDTLVAEANAWEGTVVISHEILAAASRRQVRRAIEGLDGEVHVVYSIRDLARQIPAEWQEGVKHRRKMSFAEFLDDLTQETPRTPVLQWFWSVQDWPKVLDRWGSALSPQRVHVVTVPPPDAPRSLLVGRFLRLLGVHRSWLPMPSERANPSLGSVETTVLRTLNARLPARRLKGPQYRHLMRELLAHRTLAERGERQPIALPPGLADWVVSTTEEWVAELDRRGYEVVGDLAEVTPAFSASPWYDPDTASASDQLEVAYTIIEALVLELAGYEEARGSAPAPPDVRQRAKIRALALARRNRVVGLALRAYRRVRRG